MILKDLAAALDIEFQGDQAQPINALAPIDRAGSQELAFVVNARYAKALRASVAGAVIVPESLRHEAPGNFLISPDPYADYARASWLLKPEVREQGGIHPTASIHDTATIHPSVSIGPGVSVGASSVIGEHSIVEAHCVVGDGVSIGRGCRLFPRVTLYSNVRMGDACRIQSGAVIGSEGFGYAWTSDGWQQIQQTGGVVIGNRVHVGANTTIDCGAIDPTVIADGVVMDNQIQIAHNVHIGENTAIAGCVGIAGSTHIGSHCQIGGACNIVGHLTITDQVVINAASLVSRSITTSGRYGSGTPLQPEHLWRRSFVTLGKIDDLVRRIRKLERSDRAD